VQQSDDGHQEGSHNNKDTVNSNTKPYIEPSKAKTNIASNDKDNMVVTSTGKAINSK
jgi:hypothetical protein